MRGIKILAVVGLLVLALAACAGKDVRVGAKEDEGQVELEKGQVLAVTLESNPSTGYAWEVDEVDSALLEVQGEAEYKQGGSGDQQLVGAGGTETLRFKAVGTGETTLRLIYHRSWETDVEPLQTYTLQVKVSVR